MINAHFDCVSSRTNELKCTKAIFHVMETQSRCLLLPPDVWNSGGAGHHVALKRITGSSHIRGAFKMVCEKSQECKLFAATANSSPNSQPEPLTLPWFQQRRQIPPCVCCRGKVMPSQKTKTASCLSLMLTYTQRDMDFMERIPSAFACETLPSSRLNGVETPTRGVNSYFTSTLLVGCVASVHRLKGSFSGNTMTVFILYLTQIKSSKKPSSDLRALIWEL